MKKYVKRLLAFFGFASILIFMLVIPDSRAQGLITTVAGTICDQAAASQSITGVMLPSLKTNEHLAA